MNQKFFCVLVACLCAGRGLTEQITDQSVIDALGPDLTTPAGETRPAGERAYFMGAQDSSNATTADNAFDDADPTVSNNGRFMDKKPLVVGYTFAEPKRITAYSVTVGPMGWQRKKRAPKTFTLWGSNSEDPESADAQWTNLGTAGGGV